MLLQHFRGNLENWTLRSSTRWRRTAAWRRLRSWTIVADGDRAAGADAIRSMGERAGAKTTELDGSHVIMISQPQAVTDVVLEALAVVEAQPVVG